MSTIHCRTDRNRNCKRNRNKHNLDRCHYHHNHNYRPENRGNPSNESLECENLCSFNQLRLNLGSSKSCSLKVDSNKFDIHKTDSNKTDNDKTDSNKTDNDKLEIKNPNRKIQNNIKNRVNRRVVGRRWIHLPNHSSIFQRWKPWNTKTEMFK